MTFVVASWLYTKKKKPPFLFFFLTKSIQYTPALVKKKENGNGVGRRKNLRWMAELPWWAKNETALEAAESKYGISFGFILLVPELFHHKNQTKLHHHSYEQPLIILQSTIKNLKKSKINRIGKRKGKFNKNKPQEETEKRVNG